MDEINGRCGSRICGGAKGGIATYNGKCEIEGGPVVEEDGQNGEQKEQRQPGDPAQRTTETEMGEQEQGDQQDEA